MKKIKLIGCCAALAAIIGVNVNIATTNLKEAELNLSDIENIAEGETIIRGQVGVSSWNSFGQWLSQGCTADEWSKQDDCPPYVSYGTSYSTSSSSSSGGSASYQGVNASGFGTSSSWRSGSDSYTYDFRDKDPGYRVECFNGGCINCCTQNCYRP